MKRMVLKSQDVCRSPLPGLALDLRDVRHEAELLIARARVEADQIVSAAQRQATAELARAQQVRQAAAEAGRAEGHRQGLEAGREAGRAAGLDEVRRRFAAESGDAASRIDAVLTEFAARREALRAEAARDSVTLAIAVAQRVIARASELHPGAALESAGKALQYVGDAAEVVIRVHPADAELIERYAPALMQQGGGRAAIRFAHDEAVGRGGVSVQTEHGVVDASLPTQLERVANELLHDWRARVARLTPADGAPSVGAASAESQR